MVTQSPWAKPEEEEEYWIFTFLQPVRDGYYYIAVMADKYEKALSKAEGLDLKHKTGRFQKLSTLSPGELVIERPFEDRLRDLGYAHRFVATWPLPSSQRMGHYGFLPD